MQHPRTKALLPALFACLGGSAFSCGSNRAHAQDFSRYLTGNAGNAAALPSGGGLLLAGGGTDVDAAMTWFKTKANGGDVVVLRASGSDGYNDYLFRDLPGPAIDSVETIVFSNRNAAFNAQVLQSVNQAEAIFLAGGDQSDYDDFWKGTPLEDGLHQRAAEGAVIGGTSAGLAILGSSAYVAQRRSLVSADALANPYDRDVTLEHDFLRLPMMQGVLTDSHFAQRDRQGRLLAMMARSADETDAAFGYPGGFRGIGVNEQTAVVVEPDGTATVLANGNQQRAAHLFTLTQPASVLQPGMVLTLGRVAALEIRPNETFDFNTFTAADNVGRAYSYDVVNGVLTEGPAITADLALPGDYDRSGAVEQSDLDLVLNSWGIPRGAWANVGSTWSVVVDQEELDHVLNHWGSSNAPSFKDSRVPEPVTAGSIAVSALGLLRRRGEPTKQRRVR